MTQRETELIIEILDELSHEIATMQADSCAPFPAEKLIKTLKALFDERFARDGA